MAKKPSLVAQLINSSWWLFKVAFLVALAAGSGAAFYYYQHVNDEIRNFAHDLLAKHYSHLNVEIHSAQILKGEGILIRNVDIKDPQAESTTNVLIHIDEILLACQTDLSDLMNGKPEITHITVRRPNLIARCQSDGSWSSTKLLPHPRMGNSPVEVTIEGGTVEVHDTRQMPAARFVFRDIAVTLTPIEVSKYLNDSAWNIRGCMRGDYLRQFDFSGNIAPFGHTASMSGTINGLQFNPEFRAALPRDLSKMLNELNVLNGEINLGFATRFTQANPEPWQFEVDGKLTEGRIEDQRMPQALNDVTVKFKADQKSLSIENLSARNGDTTINLAATRYGYSSEARMSLTLHAENLFIDRKWESSLPPSLREGLRKFQPAGIVDIHGTADFDGRSWNANGSMECKNISFTFYKFQYRLDRTRGVLTMKNNHLTTSDLKAYASGRPIDIRCAIHNPGAGFTGTATISGQDISLDQNLLAALPPKHREVIETLQPSGSINFNMELNQTVPFTEVPNIDLSIHLNKCSLKFTKFQYRIDDVQGEIKLNENKWSFNNLTGINDTGRIKCSGGISPTDAGDQLDMTIIGTSIPLDEELRDALPQQSQKFWTALRPSGVIDIDTRLTYLCPTHQLDMTITAIPHVAESPLTSINTSTQNQPDPLTNSSTGLSSEASVTQLAPIEEKLKLQNTLVTLEPVFFPLRFEKVRGKMIYRAGKIEFENIQAEHERLPISLSGYVEYDDNGSWHTHFQDLSIERLRIEHPKLQEALPARLRKMLQTAKWNGPMSVRGTFDVWGKQDPNWPITTIWDCDIDVRDASFHQGLEVKHLDGAVHLVGRCDGATPRVQGEIYAQSAIVHDMHLTNICGPMYFDDLGFFLGTEAIKRLRIQPPPPLRPITAKAYGGEVAIDLDIYFAQTPWYRIRAALEGVDLDQFGREQMPGRQKLAGKVQMGIDVTGNVTGLHTLNGKGGMKLKEAKLYELPVMFAVFNRFRVNDPDRTAFDTGDLSFRIDGEHIYFDSIELSGNTMSLLGTGEMNFNRELQLVFSAVMGRSDWQIPVVKNFLSSASQQFNEIHVGGTISEPEIKQQPFPGLKEALKQLQADRTQRK